MSVGGLIVPLVAFSLILLQGSCQKLGESNSLARRNLKGPRKAVKAKVAGGSPVAKGRFPYMVSLRGPTNEHACGGALIGKCWVLTAAHCVHPKRRDSVGLNAVVVIGGFENDDDDSVAGVEMMRVAVTYIHEDFDPDDLFGSGSDIALLKLEESSSKTPVGLPDPRSEFNLGDKMLIIGWGKQGVDNPASELQQAFLSFVPRDICGDKWGDTIHPSLMCASDPKADSCTGDSGGPLLVPFAPKRDVSRGSAKFDTIVGLTSFGDTTGCGSSSIPGVYTKLSEFIGWIQSTMAEGVVCSTPTPLPVEQTEKATNKSPPAPVANRKRTTTVPVPEVASPPVRRPVAADASIPVRKAAAGGTDAPKEGDLGLPEISEDSQAKLDTALLVAAKTDNRSEVKKLLKRGANVNIKMDNWTPLLVAAHEGLLPLAVILLDAGADIELAGNDGWTPLIRASFDGHNNLVRFLAEQRADVDAQTVEGNTALMHAAFRGKYRDVEVLLEVGASKSVINENGSIAAEVSCKDPDIRCPLSTKRKLEELLSEEK